MHSSLTINLGIPSDGKFLTVKMNDGEKDFNCDISVVELETNNLLVISADISPEAMRVELGWSMDDFNALTAKVITQAAVIAHYAKAGWKFVSSHEIPDNHDKYIGSVATFTFVR